MRLMRGRGVEPQPEENNEVWNTLHKTFQKYIFIICEKFYKKMKSAQNLSESSYKRSTNSERYEPCPQPVVKNTQNQSKKYKIHFIQNFISYQYYCHRCQTDKGHPKAGRELIIVKYFPILAP